ncbi:cytochrome P450 [Xylaria cf. heliscus]|nr:cytochrome P450 [Xylaria cf. heliscus]
MSDVLEPFDIQLAALAVLHGTLTKISLVLTLVLALVFWAYRQGFPRPLPGIPYNLGALNRFMGDYPEINEYIKSGKGYRVWLGSLSSRHNSPVTQVFLAPYSKPCVVLSDYRESFDILTRRTKEFDRSGRTAATVRGIVPHSLITMTSTDPRFKGNKELTKDLMTPTFLTEVSAPSAYSKTLDLVAVWRLKANLAQGQPFEAYGDLHDAALDIIMAVTFGRPESRNDTMPRHLQEIRTSATTGMLFSCRGRENCAEFPRAPLSEDFENILAVKETMRIGFSSPFPYPHIWLLKRFTKLGNSFTRKDQVIHNEISRATERLFSRQTDQSRYKSQNIRCAMDNMILRELALAKREGRNPDIHSPRLRDELFLYILGGHDTTATTLAWTVKTLADVPGPQQTLRRHLQTIFVEAALTMRQPTTREILTVSAPYLDAFLEEAMRHTRTISLLLREALEDTDILGYRIPKGTTVILNTRSSSFIEPAMQIPEHLRSKSSQAAKDKIGAWDEAGMANFEPLRWLRKSESAKDHITAGTEVLQDDDSFAKYEFNPHAGPSMTLGAGPRGCAGRRLAYMELRIVLVLLVWNFVFEACPPELSSYQATEYFTTVPEQCYVRLGEVDKQRN